MKKQVLVLIILLSVFSINLFAKENLSVPISDPVYQIIEQGQIRKLFPQVEKVRPYTANQVNRMLNDMLASGKLSSRESSLVREHLDRLNPPEDRPLLQSGRLALTPKEDASVEIGAALTTELSVSSDDPEDFDQRNMVDFIMEGGITSHFSYRINFGLRYDKLSSSAFAPYAYSSPGEGFYISYNSDSPIGYSDGQNSDYASSYYTTPEMAASFLDDKIFLRWGMIDRDWGMGNGNFFISDTARSFDAIEARFAPSTMFNLTFLTGTLTDWEDDDEFQNMFTAKRLEFYLPWGLELAFTESVVWVKRNELGYMNPFMVTTIYQNTLGNYDNMYLGMDVGWNFKEGYKLYGSYAVDEVRTGNVIDWFKEVRNIMAFQGGFKGAVPNIPFTTVNLQYTRLEPFFYTHYPQKYPSYTDDDDIETRMLTQYTNKGENLGYNLPPDSHEFCLTVGSSAVSDLYLEAQWKYMTHSDQYGSSIMDYIDYDLYEDGGYDTKDHAGHLIEKLHTVGFNADWNVRDLPINLLGGYTLAFGEIRDSSDDDWENYFNSFVNIGVKLYY